MAQDVLNILESSIGPKICLFIKLIKMYFLISWSWQSSEALEAATHSGAIGSYSGNGYALNFTFFSDFIPCN